jgi:hypothetical protein
MMQSCAPNVRASLSGPEPASEPAVGRNLASTSRTLGCKRPRHAKVDTLLTSQQNQLSANAIHAALRVKLLAGTTFSPPYVSRPFTGGRVGPLRHSFKRTNDVSPNNWERSLNLR